MKYGRLPEQTKTQQAGRQRRTHVNTQNSIRHNLFEGGTHVVACLVFIG